MADQQEYPVVTTSGVTGRVLRKARFLDKTEGSLVRLDDGREFEVPASALRVRPDGSFLLDDSGSAYSAPAPSADVPERSQPEESRRSRSTQQAAPARPPAQSVDQSARVSDSPDQYTIDEPLFLEDVGVERVSINRIVDEHPETWQDGDTTVIPVVEEVLVVQKRLLLKEEIRITKRRTEVREPRKVIMTGTDARVIGADGRDIRS